MSLENPWAGPLPDGGESAVVARTQDDVPGQYRIETASAAFFTESASVRHDLSHPTARDLLLTSIATCALGLIEKHFLDRGACAPAATVRVATVPPSPQSSTPPRYPYLAIEIRIPSLKLEDAVDAANAFALQCPIVNTLRLGTDVRIQVFTQPELSQAVHLAAQP